MSSKARSEAGPASKKPRFSVQIASAPAVAQAGSSASDDESFDGSEEGDSDGSEEKDSEESDEEEESGDEEDIRALNRARHGKRAAIAVDGEGVEDLAAGASEKTKKRKRRATSPTTFGASLSALLSQPSTGPATSSATSRIAARNARQEEAKRLRKARQESKHARQERGHVSDIIGGWGPRPARPFSEWAGRSFVPDPAEETVGGGAAAEKALRRMAQKGVVSLFNAIKAAQGAAEEETQRRLSGAQRRKLARTGVEGPQQPAKPLPAAQTAAEAAAKARQEAGLEPVSKSQPNMLGSRGKDEALANLSKASFLELIKSGGR